MAKGAWFPIIDSCHLTLRGDMGKKRYSVDQKKMAEELLSCSSIPRDSLPYHEKFEDLYTQYKSSGLPQLDKHEFWLLLLVIGKKGGVKQKNKVRLPSIVLTIEDAFEIQRLCPESIGSRDRIPYTTEFNEMYKRFKEHTDKKLTRNEFWRSISRIAKRSRKPNAIEINSTNTIPKDMVRDILTMNPWWEGNRQKPQPDYKRNIYPLLFNKITKNIQSIISVRGPRQVGKTTLQTQMIEDILYSKRLAKPQNILRIQFDDIHSLGQVNDPIIAIADWYEKNILKKPINNLTEYEQVYFFFDEVQEIRNWNVQLKHIVDHKKCKVYITGSSSLRISAGRESLAGRIDDCVIGSLNLSEIAGFRGHKKIDPFFSGNDYGEWLKEEFWIKLSEYDGGIPLLIDSVFKDFNDYGGYPFCHTKNDIAWSVAKKYLHDTVITRTIDHDLRISTGVGQGRREARLLREIFKTACTLAGQDITLNKITQLTCNTLGTNIKQSQVEECLEFLEDSLLIRTIKPTQIGYKSNPARIKICICDHAIRSSWLGEQISLIKGQGLYNEDMAGHIIESIIGYYLSCFDGLGLSYYPPKKDGEGEVDYIIEIGNHRIPLEIKYRNEPMKSNNIKNLKAFIANKNNNSTFGLIITPNVSTCQGNIIAIPAKKFLLLR